MKKCVKCLVRKGLGLFYKAPRSQDGVGSYCKACVKHQAKLYQARNPERALESHRKYYYKNKENYLEKQSRYRKLNRHLKASENARRRARKLNQTCNCCTAGDFNEFYRHRPEGYHVDHIYPLSRGGKHCLKNLQYLTVSDNLRKGSKIQERKR